MKAKIVFSDIDGTLLNSERAVSDFTISEVKRITKQGIPFVLVSARMPKQMYYLQEALGILNTPIIAYNGAVVLDSEKILQSTEMPLNIIEDLIFYNENYADNQIHISLYHLDKWYAPFKDKWAEREANNTKSEPEIMPNHQVLSLWKSENKGAHKIMLMGEVEVIQPAFDYLNKKFSDQLHIYRAKDTYIEIASLEISKLTGIKNLLQQKYPFSLEEAMAFGDNYNDIEMLENVGFGVAVENAHKEVKEAAKFSTLHHKEDGVAHFISNHFV